MSVKHKERQQPSGPTPPKGAKPNKAVEGARDYYSSRSQSYVAGWSIWDAGEGLAITSSCPDGDEVWDFELLFDTKLWRLRDEESLSEKERGSCFPQELKKYGLGRISEDKLRRAPRNECEFAEYAHDLIQGLEAAFWYDLPVKVSS